MKVSLKGLRALEDQARRELDCALEMVASIEDRLTAIRGEIDRELDRLFDQIEVR